MSIARDGLPAAEFAERHWARSPSASTPDAERRPRGLDTSDIDMDVFDSLTPGEQEELLARMERMVGGETLEEWITHHFPEEPPPRHTLPILDVMQQALVTPIRLCISVGPGHAKTTTLLRSIAWWVKRSPRDLCAYISYSESQALSKSGIARNFAEQGGVKLANRATGSWTTTHGGGLLAAGARGKLTGQRIPGLLVVDDPYKDEFEARSPAINNAVKERFKAIAFTRLQGGSVIVLHTRWAEDDLIGWLTRELRWPSINLQTVCDNPETDQLGRREGEVAWPEKYPYEICDVPCGHDGHLREIRQTIGEHLWASMYQGYPRPKGKAVFHEPARYQLGSGFDWTGKRGVIILDPAATASTSADWSVLLVLAMDGFAHESRMWFVDCVRVQYEVPEVVDVALRLQRKYKLVIGVEAMGGFKAIPQQIRRIAPTIRVMDITTGSRDKYTRALPLSAAWNSGRALVPTDTEWADTLIDEYTRFTGVNDRTDDQVDAGSHGWNVMYRNRPKITSANYAEGY